MLQLKIPFFWWIIGVPPTKAVLNTVLAWLKGLQWNLDCSICYKPLCRKTSMFCQKKSQYFSASRAHFIKVNELVGGQTCTDDETLHGITKGTFLVNSARRARKKHKYSQINDDPVHLEDGCGICSLIQAAESKRALFLKVQFRHLRPTTHPMVAS